jgi:hypothetical protein
MACVLNIGIEILEVQGSIRYLNSDLYLRPHVNIDSRVHLNPVQEHFREMLRCPNCAHSRSNSVYVTRVPILGT